MESIGNALSALVGEKKPDQTKSCDKHGEYISHNYFGTIWTRCPTCQDEAQAEEKAKRDAQDKKDRDARWEKTLGQSGIPLRFRDRTIPRFVADNDGQRVALQFAIDFTAEFAKRHSGRCAVFIGKPGTGKTHLACGIAIRAMGAHGASALFTTVAKMARRIREAKSFDAEETESQAIAMHSYPDLLIVDEVGLQSGTDAEARSLFDVVNERYEQCKPTIFLSNLDLDGVRAALGDRLFDRMREDGGEVVIFDWESQRGRGQ